MHFFLNRVRTNIQSLGLSCFLGLNDLDSSHSINITFLLKPIGSIIVLGESLVFMITTKSGYETILKDPTQFFFFFFLIQDLGRVPKICKK